MRICGIDLKSNNTILSVIDTDDEDIIVYIDMKVKKISLDNDENQNDIRQYCNDLLVFLKHNDIEKVVIKKRAKKGNFSGGAVTFKMEGLIQLNPHCEVELISSQSISSFSKKNEIEYPSNLKKYQEVSYLTAMTSI